MNKNIILFCLLQFYICLMHAEENICFVSKAPDCLQKLWEKKEEIFERKINFKPHDKSYISKYNQLQKQWDKTSPDTGHYEKKESIVIFSEDNNLNEMKECRREMITFCNDHLKSKEQEFGLEENCLTMLDANNPTHTLRLLHYLDGATATAHSDTSIMTCLYYEDPGLEVKINGIWKQAPKLKKDEMLVMYGVPGEILSNGNLKSLRHRVKCNERHAIAYFHNTPKNYVLSSENYNETTMKHIYQEAQLWYANVNARVLRKYCKTTNLSKSNVLYAWICSFFVAQNEDIVSKKDLKNEST